MRQDKILSSFLQHELLLTKYHLNQAELPTKVRDAINSEIPIVKTIGLIVEALEKQIPETDNSLRNIVLQYLNTAAV